MAGSIVVCQHNILSSLWLVEQYAMLPCYEQFRNHEHRVEINAKYLKNIGADIYCLCEVDADSFPVLQQRFNESDGVTSGFVSCFASNEPRFWSEWLEGKRQWKPNGTCMMLRAVVFSEVRAEKLTMPDGWACCFVTCTHLPTGTKLLVVSVHVTNPDPVVAANGSSTIAMVEEDTILERIAEREASEHIDLVIISGDHNTTDVSKFINRGFVEPFHNTSETTPLPQGMIDHTLVYVVHRATNRNIDVRITGKILAIPTDTATIIVPDICGIVAPTIDPNVCSRVVNSICQTIEINGSDHYATTTTLRVQTRR